MPNTDHSGCVRKRNLFNPQSKKPYRLSRFRLENFLRCPRCFYLDRRLGMEPPGMPPFTLNMAVDELLKKEFDQYRLKGQAHPLMQQFKIDAIPFSHPQLQEWRNNFKGVAVHHEQTNMVLFGAIDDLWVDQEGAVYVVDYKATSTSGAVTIDIPSRDGYKRQIEMYQWLLRKQNLDVSDMGYFVYCNATKSRPGFQSTLNFEMEIIRYAGDDSWVESALTAAAECLGSPTLPAYTPKCGYCQYRQLGYDLEQYTLFPDDKI